MGAGFALTLTLSRRRERGLSGVMPEYSAVLHPVLTLTLSRGCTVRGHREHLFGDMVDTYN